MKRKAREDLCFGVFVLMCVATFVLCAVVTASEYGYPSDTLNGDVNMDGRICMDDSMQIIYHLWRDGRELPCPDAADVDRSGAIDIGDVLGGLRHIFFGDPILDCPITCPSEY